MSQHKCPTGGGLMPGLLIVTNGSCPEIASAFPTPAYTEEVRTPPAQATDRRKWSSILLPASV